MPVIPEREQILAKAGELFHRLGYGAVDLDTIIDASGVSKATFHRHFHSKSELGQTWLKNLHKRMRLMNENFLEKMGDRERRLRRYFYSMRSWLEANGFRSCQFANTASCMGDVDEELVHLIDQYKRDQREFFINVVKTLVEPSKAQRIGTAVFILYAGGMTEAQNLKATWPLEDALVMAETLCDVKPNG
ncbi:MAG: TetR/AcrR family transcriptional regulator [Verrucomicrobiota bacterium]